MLSTIPKHLHLVCDPLTHNIVAQRMAKDNLALIHPIMMLKGRSHLAAKWLLRRFKKNSALTPNIPSMETQRGVKSALRSTQACKYFFLRFCRAQDRTRRLSIIRRCIGVNNSDVKQSGCRTHKSAIKTFPSIPEDSLTTGSLHTRLQTKEARSPKATRTSLCHWPISPPTRQSKAWVTVNGAPQPSQLEDRHNKGFL